MEITFENEEGEEITVELPTKKEVCSNCDGHGTQLREGMRGYAYTAEEFEESFDEEDRAEYFRHGGKYDVQCETCQGKNVVDVIDIEACEKDPSLAEALEAHYEQQQDESDYRRECEAERRAGC